MTLNLDPLFSPGFFPIWFSGNTEISSSWAEKSHTILLVQGSSSISNFIGNRNLPQWILQQRDQECNIHGKMSERKCTDGMRDEELGPEVTLCFDKSVTPELQNDLKGGCGEVRVGLFCQVTSDSQCHILTRSKQIFECHGEGFGASSWAWFYCWCEQILNPSSTRKLSDYCFEMHSLDLKRSCWHRRQSLSSAESVYSPHLACVFH